MGGASHAPWLRSSGSLAPLLFLGGTAFLVFVFGVECDITILGRSYCLFESARSLMSTKNTGGGDVRQAAHLNTFY